MKGFIFIDMSLVFNCDNYFNPSIMYKDESFVDIKGFEDYYQISNYGRILSKDVIWNTNKNILSRGGKIKKLCLDQYGYLRVTLWKNNKGKSFYIHRLIALHFIINPENKEQINHIDGDKLNNSISNLEWCTNKENINHSIKNKLWDYRGSNTKNSILKEEDIPIIRELLSKGISQRMIGLKFNVSRSSIKNIKSGKSWNSV